MSKAIMDINQWLDRNGIDRAYRKDMQKTYDAIKGDLEAQRDLTCKETLKAVGERLDRGIVRDLDGNRIRRQSLYPSDKEIEAFKRGEMPEEAK